MAKPLKAAAAAETNGEWPLLQAAFFCERVLEEADGVFTAVRIVDHLRLPPEPSPPTGIFITLPVVMVVGMKSGDAVGKREFEITFQPPGATKTEAVAKASAVFAGGESGIFIRTPQIPLRFEGEGIYWYTLRVFGQLRKNVHGWRTYTKVPLRVSFQREVTASPSTPQSVPAKQK